MKHGVMLYLCGDNMIPSLFAHKACGTLDSPVIAFGTAGCEIYLVRSAIEYRRDPFAGVVEYFLCLVSLCVLARRVTPGVEEHRVHCLYDLGKDRCRSSIICINKSCHFYSFYAENRRCFISRYIVY